MNKQSFFWKTQSGEISPAPVAELLGFRFIAFDPIKLMLEVEFTARHEFTNPVGSVHGGILAAMLDETLAPALAANLEQDQFAPTINLNVAFHRSAHVGLLTGKARVVKFGKDISFLEGCLEQDGQTVAVASATSLMRKMPS